MEDGLLNRESRAWIAGVLRQLPLLASQESCGAVLEDNRAWYIAQLIESARLRSQAASQKADATLSVAVCRLARSGASAHHFRRAQWCRNPGCPCAPWSPTSSPRWPRTST